MTEAAYLALESLGSAKTRAVGSRDSWAMIGVKGAPIGSVPELHVTRFNGFAEVEQAAPAVHLMDGFHFYHVSLAQDLSPACPFRQVILCGTKSKGIASHFIAFKQQQKSPASFIEMPGFFVSFSCF